MPLFHLSNIYLCVLFAAIAVDAAVGLPVLVRLTRSSGKPRCCQRQHRGFPESADRVAQAAGIRPCGSSTYFLAAPLSKSA